MPLLLPSLAGTRACLQSRHHSVAAPVLLHVLISKPAKFVPGSRNARVLPLPVGATTYMSCSSSTPGMACCCTVEGLWKPHSVMLRRIRLLCLQFPTKASKSLTGCTSDPPDTCTDSSASPAHAQHSDTRVNNCHLLSAVLVKLTPSCEQHAGVLAVVEGAPASSTCAVERHSTAGDDAACAFRGLFERLLPPIRTSNMLSLIYRSACLQRAGTRDASLRIPACLASRCS